MQHIGAEVRYFVRELYHANFWDRVIAGGRSLQARTADEIAILLEGVLTSGQVRLLPAGEVSRESTTLAESSRNSSIGTSIKLDPRSIAWSLQAGTAAERSARSTSVITHKINGETVLPFAQVTHSLQRLLVLLNSATIHILFDEWSDIDKDLRVQPYLAEMLKRTTSAVSGLYFKLACIPGRTSLATPITEETKNPLGLEEGDDIHADVNLDELVFAGESIAQLAPFFIAMIKKHVGEKLEWVRYSSTAHFENFLTSMIFSGLPALLEMCQASGGVPRDFLNIYRSATTTAANRAKTNQARSPFDLATVRYAAKNVYRSKRASFAGKSLSPQLRLLDRIYQEIYVKKRSYHFLLSEEAAERDDVQTLYMERLIHRIPATYYNSANERRYQYFQLDYGTTIDRLMANAANDVRASYESSGWVKLEEFNSKFLGRSLAPDAAATEHVYMAAFTAVFQAEPGRLDIDPREIIFNLDRDNPGSVSASSRNRGRHNSSIWREHPGD
jgi:hypothetical protein